MRSIKQDINDIAIDDGNNQTSRRKDKKIG